PASSGVGDGQHLEGERRSLGRTAQLLGHANRLATGGDPGLESQFGLRTGAVDRPYRVVRKPSGLRHFLVVGADLHTTWQMHHALNDSGETLRGLLYELPTGVVGFARVNDLDGDRGHQCSTAHFHVLLTLNRL